MAEVDPFPLEESCVESDSGAFFFFLGSGKNVYPSKLEIKNMMTYQLPEEIYMEILERLPIKSLIRFKTVCKSWKSLISTPCFIDRHFSRSAANSNKVGIALTRKCKDGPYCKIYFEIINLSPTSLGETTTFIEHVVTGCQEARPLGWCRGLLLLGVDCSDCKLLLSNPSTRESKEIPDPPYRRLEFEKISSASAFGYDFNIKSHKIVLIYELAPHWVIIRENKVGVGARHAIEYFDFAVKGSLCIVYRIKAGFNFEIWVMKRYGVKESWLKWMSFENEYVPYPICFGKNNINVSLVSAFAFDESLICFDDEVGEGKQSQAKSISQTEEMLDLDVEIPQEEMKWLENYVIGRLNQNIMYDQVKQTAAGLNLDAVVIALSMTVSEVWLKLEDVPLFLWHQNFFKELMNRWEDAGVKGFFGNVLNDNYSYSEEKTLGTSPETLANEDAINEVSEEVVLETVNRGEEVVDSINSRMNVALEEELMCGGGFIANVLEVSPDDRINRVQERDSNFELGHEHAIMGLTKEKEGEATQPIISGSSICDLIIKLLPTGRH
ncbi:hypothetical protein COLO4_25686 [Corchorus olitorius]|uniref:F-box domain-containing protein n=1 Tax=Corchorus olitorius TaxID=93759 RepID=A0A1R3I0F8_9ROSI|nr:hypothetical protein COLO4_25686 [Corchorus olitorius]